MAQLIQVDPDKLIELGHKIKELSMNQALPGDSILVGFTDKIMFVYKPEREFCKPVHTYTPVEPKLPAPEANGGLGW